MEVKRTYIHKTYGTIGTVALVAPDAGWTLDGKELNAATVTHLLTFALQTLQDAYAGSKTADEATADFKKKYDKLVAGTIGTRTGGGGMDEPELFRFISQYRAQVKAAAKVDPDAYKAATPAERDAMLIGWAKKQPKADEWRKVGGEFIAADAKKAEQAAAYGL